MSDTPSPQPTEDITSSHVLYHGRILTVRVNTVKLASGRQTTREIVEHPGAVVIVAVDDAGRVAMVRQYRAAIAGDLLELPAGTREPSESAERCAERELAEEFGLRASSWTSLGGFYSSPGFCNEYLAAFLATGLGAAPGQPEDDETIQREWIKLSDVSTLIRDGEIRDAKSIAGLLSYLQVYRRSTGVSNGSDEN